MIMMIHELITRQTILNNSTTPSDPMKSMNVVRYKVKPEYKDEFIQAVTKWELQESQLHHKMIRTGDYQFCGIMEWETGEALDSAMPYLIKFLLEPVRHMLE